MQSPVICIMGGAFRNKGAEAMLHTVASTIRQSFPNSRIKVWLRKNEHALANEFNYEALTRSPREATFSAVHRATGKLKTFLTYIRSDALVDIGGYQFGDDWGNASRFRGQIRSMKWSRRFGVPVVYMPQAWGPFTKPGMKAVAAEILNHSTVAYVRDNQSLAHLDNALGYRHPSIKVAPDIAWNFSTPSPCPHAIADQHRGKELICLTPNLRIYEKHSETGADNPYVKLLAGLALSLTQRDNTSVILLGHELANGTSSRPDDRIVCDAIHAATGHSASVLNPKDPFSADEIKQLIRSCTFVVSSRFHCLIAALSQGVPAAALGWSHKYDELLRDVGLPSNVISTSLSSQELAAKIQQLISERAEQQRILKESVPRIKTAAKRPLDELLALLREKRR